MASLVVGTINLDETAGEIRSRAEQPSRADAPAPLERKVTVKAGRLARAARLGALACAGTAVAAMAWLMAHRIAYPFELNWMEGGVLQHVQRIVAGEPLYTAPGFEFVPFIYSPGFYYAAALVTQVLGGEFWSLRIVSVVSSFGVMTLVSLFVWRETRQRDLAVIAFGLVAATYGAGGFWFDVGRVDMLFLVLALAGFFAIRFGSGVASNVLAGLLLAAAFLTKQQAAIVAAPVIVWFLLVRRRPAAVLIAAGGTAALGTTLWLDAVHEGWYRFYVFELPSSFQLSPGRLVRFWTHDLLPTMPVAIGLSTLYVFRPGLSLDRLFYAAMATGLVAGAWLSRAHDGGTTNVLIPALVALCLVGLLGVDALLRSSGRTSAGRIAWLYAAVIVQFVLLSYDPRNERPHPQSVPVGAALVRALSDVTGPVWVPYHGYLAVRAGKSAHAHWMAVSDVLRHAQPAVRDRLRAQIERAIDERRFELLVLSSRPFPNFPPIDHAYDLQRRLFESDSEVLQTLSGARRRPEAIYVPK